MINTLNKHRNYLHSIPEIALEEFETAKYIRDVLKDLQVKYETIGTSTIGFINGESEDCIAFRADIDGLPLCEKSENPYRSKNKNMMHACGHDGHTAILLTFIEDIINKIKNGYILKKTLLFIFQAGEEGAGGARFIVDNSFYKNKKIENIFALHVSPELKTGEFAFKKGPVSMQNINLDIKITGKGCHGAQPHKGIDSILIGAKLIEAYQSIRSRNIPSNENFLLTIGSFNAGSVRNIIPECVYMLGTIRLENTLLIPFVKERIEKINRGFQEAYDVEIDFTFKPFYPPVINNEELYNLSLKVMSHRKYYTDIPLGGSEDFSFYLQNGTSGFLALLGVCDENKEKNYSLHNDKFDFYNNSLIYGVEYFQNILLVLNK